MRDRHCSAAEAFDSLVRLSQDTHMKLRDVARRLVDQVQASDKRAACRRSGSGAGGVRSGEPGSMPA
jgi:hypothetical protein